MLPLHSAVLTTVQGKDNVFLCSLNNFDAFYMIRPYKGASTKGYCWAVKSTDSLTFFENTADYLHVFQSNSEAEGKAWIEKILLARVSPRSPSYFCAMLTLLISVLRSLPRAQCHLYIRWCSVDSCDHPGGATPPTAARPRWRIQVGHACYSTRWFRAWISVGQATAGVVYIFLLVSLSHSYSVYLV